MGRQSIQWENMISVHASWAQTLVEGWSQAEEATALEVVDDSTGQQELEMYLVQTTYLPTSSSATSPRSPDPFKLFMSSRRCQRLRGSF